MNKWQKNSKKFAWKRKDNKGKWQIVIQSDSPDPQTLSPGFWQVRVNEINKSKGLTCYHLSVGYVREEGTVVGLVKEGRQYVIQK